ncbi:thioesterase II family protein [Streptosporangium sp. NPDC004379]|uniref:thioesterase II family protein n=1 Tax=Streptosporangium sp. NPDC004379 TaxID=3366189 RepID=UPI00369C4B2D
MTAAARWIRRFHPSPGSDVQVVCFPHAGGTASYYHPLSAALAPAAEMLAVQYPGRQDRFDEPLIDDLSLLADRTAEALGGGDRPRVFFGHSMGAVMAFEVARRLDRGGPVALFVSGRRAPSTTRLETAHLLGDDELVALAEMLGGSDPEVLRHEELRGLILPSLRADYRAVCTHSPDGEARLAVPITALTGDADPVTSVAEAEAWGRHTTSRFELKVFPGGHFFLTGHVPEIARMILGSVRAVHA